MDRDCNKCVYSTRDGSCRKFDCNGTVTVEDIKKEAIKGFAEWYFTKYFKAGADTIDGILSNYERSRNDTFRDNQSY